ncbi:MAG: penicillin-binding protein 1A [Pseudomonadota bacterium]
MSFLTFLLRLFMLGLFGGVWLLAGVYLYLSPNLPDVETLRDVKLQTPMRVYTRDGELIGQFGEQKRSPLPFDEIPPQFIDALLAAEDDNFFQHRGIDFMGLMRAVSELVLTGEKGSGGSTLTMQVARNYFLTLDRTFIRKFNEILLALEIERSLDKQEIFELYFNSFFLGHRAYGFEAASQVYYGASIGELSLAQHAMLAGIPKAPSRNNPISGPTAGTERRNWILDRMLALGYVDDSAYQEAKQAPVTARHHGERIAFSAHYAAEMARQEMVARHGIEAYTGGYHVYTTIDSHLQQVARKAVISGLTTYDRRHGYRGAERRLQSEGDRQNLLEAWQKTLAQTAVIAGMTPAVVTDLNLEENSATLIMADGNFVELAWENGLKQARPYRTENIIGSAPKSVSDVIEVGNLVRVVKEETEDESQWRLTQVPAAQAALVSLDPDDGAIVAVVGGMGFELSKFNRVTQAQRQPGSSFKPFVYSAALESGFTAASIINDAPVVMEDSSLEDVWRPENDGGKFHGPTRLRWALTKSRNLVSIRLLQQLGAKQLIDYITQLGFDTKGLTPDLSLALGTLTMSPLQVATGYAMLANGGYRVEPYLIERVADLEGELVYEAQPLTVCRDCAEDSDGEDMPEAELSMEDILAGGSEDLAPLPHAPRVMDERVNFIVNSMLQDVITRGTGRRALVLERNDLAGKTGTTNGPMDAWFSGYNRDVATSTWVGFDNYTPLGRKEFGGTAALPIWIEYMAEALADSPQQEAPLPSGISHVKIDPDTGLLARTGQRNAIFEYFREENVPLRDNDLDGQHAVGIGTDDLIQDIF